MTPPDASIHAKLPSMPDVATHAGAPVRGTLERVGMSGIEVPVLIHDSQGDVVRVSAKADAYVSLDEPEAKGIHMSRLFLVLEEQLDSGPVTPHLLRNILKAFLETHADISQQASVALHFDYLIKRKALKSDNYGWRSYPVDLVAVLDGDRLYIRQAVRVTYSSTCPCSAALARQLIQDKFRSDFAGKEQVDIETLHRWLGNEQSICATPHSQRSYADVIIQVDDPAHAFDWTALIDGIEGVLTTAVQAAVKREDEQEFALRNGQNLMFCEDAARRVRHWADRLPQVVDYRVKVSHVESLHPHDAVSIVTKGVEGGFVP